jgi:hypothetical protein
VRASPKLWVNAPCAIAACAWGTRNSLYRALRRNVQANPLVASTSSVALWSGTIAATLPSTGSDTEV